MSQASSGSGDGPRRIPSSPDRQVPNQRPQQQPPHRIPPHQRPPPPANQPGNRPPPPQQQQQHRPPQQQRPPPPSGNGHRPPPPHNSGHRPPPPNGSGHRPPPPNGSNHRPPPPNGSNHRPPPPNGSGHRPPQQHQPYQGPHGPPQRRPAPPGHQYPAKTRPHTRPPRVDPPPNLPPQQPQARQNSATPARYDPVYLEDPDEEKKYEREKEPLQTKDSSDSEDEEEEFGDDEGQEVDDGDVEDEDEEESLESIDFLDDRWIDMTWGRRIAMALKRYSCYYSGAKREAEAHASMHRAKDGETAREVFGKFSISRPGAVGAYPFTMSKEEHPSLSKAWAYFEHFTLPRYVVNPEDSGLDSAEPGENHLPTKLYNPFCTPHRQLGDWGIGVGLYFETLRSLCILMFLAGLLSLPNILYFASDDYGDGDSGVRSYILKGSAICTNTSFVPCSDCTLNDFPDGRVGTGTDETGQEVIFALRNFCDGATVEQGMVNLGVLGFVALGLLLMNIMIKRMEVQFDEDEQTAQDYSIVITNPPPDAYDPEEWRAFFYDSFQGAHVTTCTVGVDNDLLVSSLVERREKLKLIEMRVEPGTSLDTLTLASLAAQKEKKRRFFGRLFAKLLPGIPELVSRVVVLTSRVQGLAQQQKVVSNVFITFEAESEQRRVLDSLLNGDPGNTSKLLFRGEHILKVKEPDEPNTIRWQDLNEKKKDRYKQQFFTSLTTVVAILVVALVVQICNRKDPLFSAFAIALFNVMFPMFAKILTDFERHHSEGTKQRSLYFKIALFRWVNTAVVISIITPFTYTLKEEDGLISQVWALFFAEIVTTNAIQLSDISGHINRHLLAPKAKTQDAMNLSMKGADVQLAERMTGITKLVFLALYFNSIFPTGLFFCSLALFINYFTDRFSLMRTWKRMPHLGPRISQFSRYVFFPTALAAMALLSSYFWSAFPMDNLCENEGKTAGEDLSGTYFVEIKGDGNDNETVTVNQTSPTFEFCKQDYLRYYEGELKIFPFSPENQKDGKEWMTDDQETVTEIWSLVAIAVVAVTLLIIVLVLLRKCCCKPKYRPRGDVQGMDFSECPSISSYLPQVYSPVFSYPLVACNTDNIDEELFDWADPERPYLYYDITKDAKFLLEGTDVEEKIVFSQVAHWPPEKHNKSTTKKRTVFGGSYDDPTCLLDSGGGGGGGIADVGVYGECNY